jgi:hypothetical protein
MKKPRALPDAIAKGAEQTPCVSRVKHASQYFEQLLMTEWSAFAEAVLSSTEEGKY